MKHRIVKDVDVDNGLQVPDDEGRLTDDEWLILNDGQQVANNKWQVGE